MAAVRSPFDDLESNDPAKVEEFKVKIKEQFNRCKDPWILNGIYDHFLRTQSLRVVDVIAMVTEPHDKHFLDRASEGLRSSNKLQHLTLLGYLVRKRPLWLYKIFHHNLWAQLLSIIKTETDIVIIVSALLILNILITSVPRLVGPLLPEIFAVFSKLAALNTNANNYQDVQLVHLQISLYTLFHRLYGMFPNNFINFLRKEYFANDSYGVFSHTVKPMLDTVRVHHLLISADEKWEVEPTRWNNTETHDIIVSCANLLLNGGSSSRECYQQNIYEPKPTFNCNELLDAVKVTGKQSVAEYCKQLGKGVEDPTTLSPSVRFLEKRPMESVPAPIPLTPITRGYEVSSPYSEHEGSSPPEAAVEATPETTPIRDCLTTAPPSFLMTTAGRPLSLLKDSIQQGVIVPTTDRSLPGSPIRKDATQIHYPPPEITLCGSHQSSSRKFNMLLTDRSQATSNDSAVELKPIVDSVVRNTKDLISKDRMLPVISSANTSTIVDDVNDGKENETSRSDKCDASVDDPDTCEMEKCGSPCSRGGLHMPDSKSWSNFAMHMIQIRSRQNSQCTSDSERLSPSNSPQDRVNYFKNSKVRRTNSCPEMKKSSPNSTTLSSDSPVLEERDENDELYDLEKGFPMRRKTKKFPTSKVTIETQTDDIPSQPHFPYEHLFLDIFPPLHPPQYEEEPSPAESTNSLEERSPASVYKKAHSPSNLLQKYIEAAGQCYNDKIEIREHRTPSMALENKYLLDQLRLMGVQLQLEEHKRELHAERNRRLLPRSRRNKTLEEHNNALMTQVTLLQKEIQNCNEEVTKIVKEKEVQISREKDAVSYWRTRYGSLVEEHNAIKSRCQNVEALLKEEKDLNEQNIKELNETKAILGDITNDLSSCRKDAMEVKDLRHIVAELQFEIIKAGELLNLYRNRLIEANLPTEDKAQIDHVVFSYIDEREKLKKIINEQKASLQATEDLVKKLRKEIENRDSKINELNHELEITQESLEKAVKDWKKKYEEIKTLYDQEQRRAGEFEMQVNRVKLLMKSTNTKMVPQKNMTTRRGNTSLADDGVGSSATGLKSFQGAHKSLKNFAHSSQQQMIMDLECADSAAIPASEPHRPSTSSISEQPKEGDSQLRIKVEKTPSPAKLVSRESSLEGEGTGAGVIKSITKKKTRTECAESGQLRSISYTQLDPEPLTRKE